MNLSVCKPISLCSYIHSKQFTTLYQKLKMYVLSLFFAMRCCGMVSVDSFAEESLKGANTQILLTISKIP